MSRPGFITLLKHWVVEDCGTILNPQLVDEQVRGGVVQGLGPALYEQCLYDETRPTPERQHGGLPGAQWRSRCRISRSATSPARLLESELGAKGAGEAGTAGAAAATMNAVNDALAPLGAQLTAIPLTPERVLRALGRV